MLPLKSSTPYILHSKINNTSFVTKKFLAKCKKLLPYMDTDFKRIHSGIFIPDIYREFISSIRIEGHYVSPDNENVSEIIVIKSKIDIDIVQNAPLFEKYIGEYMEATKLKSAFIAVLSPSASDMHLTYFAKLSSPSTTPIEPSIVRFQCCDVVNKFLAEKYSLPLKDIQIFFGDEYFLFDSTLIELHADLLDKTLETMTICDLYADNATLIKNMERTIVKYRKKLNKFFPANADRNDRNFVENFYENTIFFTHLSETALMLTKIDLELSMNAISLPKLNATHGNILTSDILTINLFDIVLTIPPHIRFEHFAAIKDALSEFASYKSKSDLYCYYIERGFSMLKEHGYFSALTTDRWLTAEYGAEIREFLLKKNIENIVLFNSSVEAKHITGAVLYFTANNDRPQKTLDIYITDSYKAGTFPNYKKFRRDLLNREPWYFVKEISREIISKMLKLSIPLEEYADKKVYRGLLTGMNKAFVIKEKRLKQLCKIAPSTQSALSPFLSGRDVKRYKKSICSRYLISFPKGYTNNNRGKEKPLAWIVKKHPAIMFHLADYETKAKKRSDQGDYWWELRSCRYYDMFKKTKLICPSITKKLSATIDKTGAFSNDKTIIIANGEDYFLLGLLNSQLFDFYFRQKARRLLNNHYELTVALLSSMPVFNISPTAKKQNIMKEKISECAKMLFELHNDVNEIHVKDLISAKEKELNMLVYKLYRLTTKERRFVINN